MMYNELVSILKLMEIEEAIFVGECQCSCGHMREVTMLRRFATIPNLERLAGYVVAMPCEDCAVPLPPSFPIKALSCFDPDVIIGGRPKAQYRRIRI
jgi:hypothetical protein